MLSKVVLLIILSILSAVYAASIRFQNDVPHSSLPRWPRDGNCRAGVLYKKQCNICQCIIDGFGICSEVACKPKDLRYIVNAPDLPPWPGVKSCIRGEIYRNDCNTCVCFKSGFGVCSKVKCKPIKRLKTVEIVWNVPFRASELPFEGTCGPKTNWKRCKTCSCQNGNDANCQLQGCLNHNELIYS